MAFSEAVKLAVKRKAHFGCCVCQRHSVSLEVHHIIPQTDGGSDDEDNAAPLCPTCHEEYGANPLKRTAIRVQRDFWYEICERRYASDPDKLDEVLRSTEAIKGLLESVARTKQEGTPRIRTIAEIEEVQQDHTLLFLYHSLYRAHHLYSDPVAIDGAKDVAEQVRNRFSDDALEPINDDQMALLWERLCAFSWVLGIDLFTPRNGPDSGLDDEAANQATNDCDPNSSRHDNYSSCDTP